MPETTMEKIKKHPIVVIGICVTATVSVAVTTASWFCEQRILLLEQELSLANAKSERFGLEIKSLSESRKILIKETQKTTQPQQIKVTRAVYGNNIKKDVTSWFSGQCDGEIECVQTIKPYTIFGDHEFGIPKGLEVTYSCTNGLSNKKFHLPPFVEPLDVRIRLVCP